MHRKPFSICVFLILIISVPFLIGCSSNMADSSAKTPSATNSAISSVNRSVKSAAKSSVKESRITVYECLSPSASGSVTYGNDSISIDASNSSEGYVMVRYTGTVNKVKLQITVPDTSVYSYTLSPGAYETFPLPGGNGNYHLDILEHAYDNLYALAFSQDIQVSIKDEFKPFLYPNQYVWFTKDYEAVKYGETLSESSANDLDYVNQVYHYVIENITYDDALAAAVTSGYLPDIDVTLRTKKGICFDYASLMAAMLRSQNIPTKLVVGYSGDAYHAWISVYTKETGWVDDIIQFDGKNWTLIDPTLASNNSKTSVKKYIGDGSNYTVKYSY